MKGRGDSGKGKVVGSDICNQDDSEGILGEG